MSDITTVAAAPLTKEEAIRADHFHYTGRNGGCRVDIGPRGGRTEVVTKVRRSGITKTWKRQPERFSLPVKYGMYDSTRYTESDAAFVHPASRCPAGISY